MRDTKMMFAVGSDNRLSTTVRFSFAFLRDDECYRDVTSNINLASGYTPWEMGYWSIVEPVWNAINIGDGPEIFAQTFASVPRVSGLIFAAHFCQSEICNGGFRQFFWNSTGVLAPEAVVGFRDIGQAQVAA